MSNHQRYEGKVFVRDEAVCWCMSCGRIIYPGDGVLTGHDVYHAACLPGSAEADTSPCAGSGRREGD